MPHRIEMNVIEMAGKIIVIAHRMFPEPPLPQTILAFPIGLQTSAGRGDLPAEQALICRQRPEKSESFSGSVTIA